MKNIKTNFYILISFIFLTNYAIGQDFKKIDNEFTSKNNIDSDESYINIYLNSNDCYRCYGEIQQILNATQEKKPNLTVNVFSDQVVFAKKSTKDYSLNNLNIYFDNNIFNLFSKSFFYYKSEGKIINDYDQIMNILYTGNNSQGTNADIEIAIKDKFFTSDELSHVGIYNNELAIMDSSVDTGAIIDLKNFDIEYHELTTVSKKLYNLPHPNLPFENITLIEHEKLQDLKKQFPGTTETKVTSIKIHDNLAFAQFIVSKTFEMEEKDKLSTFSFSYIGIKHIGNELSDIFDMDTYDHYLGMDILPYNSTDYRFGVSIYYPFKILDKYHFKAKIYQELDYAGEAIFEFNDDYTTLNITSIDTEASKIYEYIFLEIDGKEYYVDKEMTDESTGEGIISLKERVIQNNN